MRKPRDPHNYVEPEIAALGLRQLADRVEKQPDKVKWTLKLQFWPPADTASHRSPLVQSLTFKTGKPKE
jgi:hypothetical protein